jgi:hypothetical protein
VYILVSRILDDGQREKTPVIVTLLLLHISSMNTKKSDYLEENSCRVPFSEHVRSNLQHSTAVDISFGHAVAKWLRYCATSMKVAGSRPDEVNFL